MTYANKSALIDALEALPLASLTVREMKEILGTTETYSIFGGESEVTEKAYNWRELLKIAESLNIPIEVTTGGGPISAHAALALYSSGKLKF